MSTTPTPEWLTHAEVTELVERYADARPFLRDARTPGREPVSPPPVPSENGAPWPGLGRAHDWRRCRVCRDVRRELVSLALAAGCLAVLIGGLLIGWWTP
jgi:hypothetical protein